MMLAKQIGSSLVAMLVGLVLVGIALVTMASTFKVVSLQSIESRVSSKQDTQVALALVALPLAMSKAGYGIESKTNSCLGTGAPGPSGTVNSDLVLVQNPVTTVASDSSITLSGVQQTISTVNTTASTGQAVIWHWYDGGSDQCAGVLSISGGLQMLSPRTCTNASDWNAIFWTTQDLIAPNSLDGKAAAVFSVKPIADCSPYGVGINGSGVLVEATVGHSTGVLSTTESFCLPNICKE